MIIVKKSSLLFHTVDTPSFAEKLHKGFSCGVLNVEKFGGLSDGYSFVYDHPNEVSSGFGGNTIVLRSLPCLGVHCRNIIKLF